MLIRVKGFISDILTLMELHISSATVQLNLIWYSLGVTLSHIFRAILNLTINLNEAKNEFGKKGGCKAIIKAMATFRDHLDVQHACLAAILQHSTKSKL